MSYVRKPITLNSLRAVLHLAEIAVKGETAVLDTAGNFRVAAAGTATFKPVGTFTESFTGDGTRTTVVSLFEEIRAQEWVNDPLTPVVMPANRGDVVFMLDGRTVTADPAAGANAILGIALDIDSTGRVIVATRPFFIT